MSVDIPLADKLRVILSYAKFKAEQKRLRTKERIIVDTIYGKIKGAKWRTFYNGLTYYSFEGIPFAKPPLGDLRFKAPVEPEPWLGCKRCTRVRSKPFQYNLVLKQNQGSEDCLYLNVYTKNLNPAKAMPVMVWIFGGAFQMGEASRDICSPDYIIMENVVLVTVTYRLGPLGFLSLSDEDCNVPGNAGLKDQILALKWVKKNCNFFGGDCENITVFGESAGAASIHYLMMTEQTKNLFQKAIAMSGSVLMPWANVPHLDWAFRLAKAAGYNGENIDKNVLHFLKHLKPGIMFKICDKLLNEDELLNKRLHFSFGPCVEPYKTEHCVIDREPIKMLKDNWGNNIPLLIGGNSSEGLITFLELRKYPNLINNTKVESTLPQDANLTPEKRLEYGQLLQQIFFGDKKLSSQTLMQYCDLCSYTEFWHGIQRTLLARQAYAKAPTFLYRFDFDSKHCNFIRILMCGRKVRGTCHGDELTYIFHNFLAKKLKHRSAEYKTMRRLVTMLVKFAEHGDPNIPSTNVVSWATFDDSDQQENYHYQKYSTIDGDKQQKIETNINHVNQIDNFKPKTRDDDDDDDDSIKSDDGDCGNKDANKSLQHHQMQHQYWPPICHYDEATTFKCLNISDELEVIDLPEAEKLKIWDSLYEDKSLLY